MECYFCRQNKDVAFHEIQTIKRFTSGLAKIKPRHKTGICALHQRQLATAIKRARMISLLPFVPK